MKNTFVSGSDANYFPLLIEWVHSVKRFPESKNFDICIMDTGLTSEQVQKLKPLVTTIVKPDWPCELPASKTEDKEYLKSCVCRPFIPQIFQGYETYFWMDADTWVQNWRGVDLFMQGAAMGKITLTSQADRAYPRVVRIKWLGQWPAKVRTFYFSNAKRAFGFKTAKALLPYHVLLAGAFAMRADAPHWKRWQELVIYTMKHGKVFTAEQLSLGKMCYLEGFSYEVLPAWTHWLCEFKPLWDESKKKFVEPFLPHEEIGILHLSGFDQMRVDRTETTDFKTPDGSSVEKSYRFADFDGEAA